MLMNVPRYFTGKTWRNICVNENRDADTHLNFLSFFFLHSHSPKHHFPWQCDFFLSIVFVEQQLFGGGGLEIPLCRKQRSWWRLSTETVTFWSGCLRIKVPQRHFRGCWQFLFDLNLNILKFYVERGVRAALGFTMRTIPNDGKCVCLSQLQSLSSCAAVFSLSKVLFVVGSRCFTVRTLQLDRRLQKWKLKWGTAD